jgi:hypothetical protein
MARQSGYLHVGCFSPSHSISFVFSEYDCFIVVVTDKLERHSRIRFDLAQALLSAHSEN